MRATIFLCTLVVSSIFDPPLADVSFPLAIVVLLLMLLDVIELAGKDRKSDRQTDA